MYQSHLALNKSKYSKNFLYIFIVMIFFSCGKISPEGKIESKDIKVEDFVSLNLDGKFRAFYVKSDSSFVNVETYKSQPGRKIGKRIYKNKRYRKFNCTFLGHQKFEN